MQKIFKKFLSFGLAVAMCFGITAVVHTTTESYVTADAATTTTASSYYSGITATSGNQLLGQLHDLITTTHTKYTSYADCKSYGPKTDPGPNGGALEFYTHESIMNFVGGVGDWNREHVWCQSLSNGMWGTSGGGSDMHHIRPSESGLNSIRGNNKYGKVNGGKEAWSRDTNKNNSKLGGYVGGGTFEPLDNVKGDVARIVMYVYTHYNTYKNVYGTTNGSGGSFGTLKFTNVMTASSESAAISMLLEWNKLDPVDEIERYRNEEVYKVQHNRNPFIDNSSYADAIWGGGTATPGPDTPTPPPVDPEVTLTGLTLNATALTLNAGKTYDLTVKPTPSNASASVGWSSSNEAVATVANGKITAKAEGTATITATSTVNSAIKAQAIVTVLPVASSGLEKATMTIGNFALSGGYGFQKWEADGISGTAYIYGGNSDNMQFNKSKDSYYLASTTPTSGAIKSVTVKAASGDRPWKLLTSNSAYGEVKGKPTEGNDRGTKTLTTDGVTWTVDGNDTYFALTYELDLEKGAAYLESIEVEYGEKDTEVTPPALESIAINPSVFTLEEGGSTKLSVVSVPSTVTAEVEWSSSDTAIATVAQDGTVTAVAAGNAEIFAIVNGKPEISAKATVTVTAKAVEPEKPDPEKPDPEKPDPEKPDPENPDSAKIEAFHNAVVDIPASGALATRLTKINAAITAYRALTSAEKTAAAEDVAALQQAIKVYNLAVNAYNQAAADAEENAINGAGNFFKRG